MTETNSASPDLAVLLSRASVEVSSGGRQLAELSDRFSPGIDVTITFLPGDDCRHNIETAAALRRLGFNPVLHIAAREMRSHEGLDDFLKRARGEADANRVLLIAGDTLRALGPFKSSADICASGLIEAQWHPRGQFRRPSGRPSASRRRAGDGGARGQTRVGTELGRPRRSRVAILLRKRSHSRVAQGTRGAPARHSRSHRPRRSGFARDARQVRSSLRRRKLAEIGARTHRPLRAPPYRRRTRRRPAWPHGVAFDRESADRRTSFLSVRRPAQDQPMAAELRRPRMVADGRGAMSSA